MHDVQSQAKHAEPMHFGSKEELENIGLFLTKNLTVNYSATKFKLLIIPNLLLFFFCFQYIFFVLLIS